MAASDVQLATFQAAFNRLKQTVSFDDACAFQSTTLKDVWKAAKEIQTVKRQGYSLRNMARLKPLLESLGKYSKTIEVLCNGTPFLPWIWAPIKLMLQLANEHSNALDQLLGAYMQIAEALPRFDRFQNAFSEDKNLQNALAMVYEDILEFHRSSYQFFRRGSWHIFFDSLWKNFAVRFHGILESLVRHREHVDKEASSIAILEAKQWRTQHRQYVERQEIERQEFVLQEAITWLAVEGRLQEDELDRLSDLRHPGTCRWILRTPPLESWIGSLGGNSILWLNGIPGAGKSVLTSYLIQHLQCRPDITVVYFFCNDDTKDQLCSLVLRTLAVQLLRSQPDLASHIFDNYCRCRSTPSLSQIKKLLPDLMAACPPPHIIIDGLDECGEKDQRAILAELLALAKYPNTDVRIMISSRDETYISRNLQKVPTISLTDKKESLNADIREYVRCKLAPLRDSFGDAIIDEVEVTVASKANGMFLWVRLIIKELEDRRSVSELRDASNNLPQGLHKAYGRILERIRDQYSEYSRDKAIRILEWMACSFRPLKVHEIQDGIFFEPGNRELTKETKLHPSVIEVCKPIIQIGVNKTLSFVHFSAKEYILHRRSGNFILESQAHHTIAYSCVSYLLTSSKFFGSHVPEHESLLRVVKSFHGLHPYAHEFWHKHVVRHAEMQDACHAPLSSDLVQQLGKLEEFRKVTVSPAFQRLLIDQKVILEVEKLLPPLHENRGTRMLLRDIKLFQDMINQRNSGSETHHNTRKYETENDPTLLSDINYRYQDILEQLLRVGSLPGVDDQLLRAFKGMYGDSAFLCRYRPCTSTSRGFSDVDKRDRHEATHIRSFKCGDEKCDFYAVGFATKTALQRHSEIYHNNFGQQMIMPIRQRRQSVTLRERFQSDGITQTPVASKTTGSANNPSQAGLVPVSFPDPNHPRAPDDEPATVKKRSNLPLSVQEVQKAFQFLERSKNNNYEQRPTYSQVCLLEEKLIEQGNESPSELQKLREQTEDWMRKGKKLFGKEGAPLHILKTHMDYVLQRNIDCFAINTDRPRLPTEPASREPSPSVGKLHNWDDPSLWEVFCICRRISTGMMIECDLCHEWYHSQCLKIARGKIKDDEKYICPICDWRIIIPRRTARPKLEDLEYWKDGIPLLPFRPNEEEILLKIINNAQEFRLHIAPVCSPVMATEDESETQRFYLRKIEGAEILLVYETNFFRQELHKWSPVAPEPPPILEVSKSTRKPRPTRLQKLMAQYGVDDPEALPQNLRTKVHHSKRRAQQS